MLIRTDAAGATHAFLEWLRVIARKERHAGAQLRLTEVDGYRITAFATNTSVAAAARAGTAAPSTRPRRGPNPQRQRHRPDELPLHASSTNRIWCALVGPASELLAWTPAARLHRPRRPPVGTQRLRLRVFSAPATWPGPADRCCSTSASQHQGVNWSLMGSSASGPLLNLADRRTIATSTQHTPGRGTRRAAETTSAGLSHHPAQSPPHSRRAAETMINKPAMKSFGPVAASLR